MNSKNLVLILIVLCIITLFLNCGMRLAELVSIDINHIKFDENILMG